MSQITQFWLVDFVWMISNFIVLHRESTKRRQENVSFTTKHFKWLSILCIAFGLASQSAVEPCTSVKMMAPTPSSGGHCFRRYTRELVSQPDLVAMDEGSDDEPNALAIKPTGKDHLST